MIIRRAVRDDRRLLHCRMPLQRRLDLPRLDPKATDLDLLVDAPEELDAPVGQEPGAVARPVDPRARDARERVRDEALGSLVGPVQVAARHPGSADPQLARRHPAASAHRRVDDVSVRVVERPADRHGRRRPGGIRGRPRTTHVPIVDSVGP